MLKEPRVMVVSESAWAGSEVMKMFKSIGFQNFVPVLRKDEPDLICFLGGEDINPKLYGEEILPCTRINQRRDTYEIGVFNNFPLIPKVGICRGGQLLNVLSGGAMWQNVDGHTGHHNLIDLWEEEYYNVTSTHHQMMIPGPGAEELAIAWQSKKFQTATKRDRPDHDTEVVFYRKTNSLCFQPHPEYGPGDTRDLFAKYLKKLWNYGPDLPKKEEGEKIDVC